MRAALLLTIFCLWAASSACALRYVRIPINDAVDRRSRFHTRERERRTIDVDITGDEDGLTMPLVQEDADTLILPDNGEVEAALADLSGQQPPVPVLPPLNAPQYGPEGLCLYYAMQGTLPRFCQEGGGTLDLTQEDVSNYSPEQREILDKIEILSRESRLVQKICRYYVTRGYQPVFCRDVSVRGNSQVLEEVATEESSEIENVDELDAAGRKADVKDDEPESREPEGSGSEIDAQTIPDLLGASDDPRLTVAAVETRKSETKTDDKSKKKKKKAQFKPSNDKPSGSTSSSATSDLISAATSAAGAHLGHVAATSFTGVHGPPPPRLPLSGRPSLEQDTQKQTLGDKNDSDNDRRRHPHLHLSGHLHPYYNPYGVPPFYPPTQHGSGAFNPYHPPVHSGRPTYPGGHQPDYGLHPLSPGGRPSYNSDPYHPSYSGRPQYDPSYNYYQNSGPYYNGGGPTNIGGSAYAGSLIGDSFQPNNPYIQPSTTVSSGQGFPAYNDGPPYVSTTGSGYVPGGYILTRSGTIAPESGAQVQTRDKSDTIKKVAAAAAATGVLLAVANAAKKRHPHYTSSSRPSYGYYPSGSFHGYQQFPPPRPPPSSGYYYRPPQFDYRPPGQYYGPFYRALEVPANFATNPMYVVYAAPGGQIYENATPIEIDVKPIEEESSGEEANGLTRHRRYAAAAEPEKASAGSLAAAGVLGLAAGSLLTNKLIQANANRHHYFPQQYPSAFYPPSSYIPPPPPPVTYQIQPYRDPYYDSGVGGSSTFIHGGGYSQHLPVSGKPAYNSGVIYGQSPYYSPYARELTGATYPGKRRYSDRVALFLLSSYNHQEASSGGGGVLKPYYPPQDYYSYPTTTTVITEPFSFNGGLAAQTATLHKA